MSILLGIHLLMELGWDLPIDSVLNLGVSHCSILKGTYLYCLRTSPDFILHENNPSRLVVPEPRLRWKSFRSTCALVLNVSWKKTHPLHLLCSTILYAVVAFVPYVFTFQAIFKTRAPNFKSAKIRSRSQKLANQNHGESCGRFKVCWGEKTLDLNGFAFRQDLFGKAIQRMSEWP